MKGMLFDLDGTLVDTLEDIRCALNHTLRLAYAREITREECRTVVGRGLRRALVDALWFSRSAFPEDELDILYSELIASYSAHVCDHSKVYDGIMELLGQLKGEGIVTGVLSNKADSLVQTIVSTLFPSGTFDFVRGLRPSDSPKPENRSVEDFIKLCNAEPCDVTIVGDSEVDWLSAQAFGCASVIVTYGYRERKELEEAGVKVLVDSPQEVLWTSQRK